MKKNIILLMLLLCIAACNKPEESKIVATAGTILTVKEKEVVDIGNIGYAVSESWFDGDYLYVKIAFKNYGETSFAFKSSGITLVDNNNTEYQTNTKLHAGISPDVGRHTDLTFKCSSEHKYTLKIQEVFIELDPRSDGEARHSKD